MPRVLLTPHQREELEALLRRGKTEVRLHRRARMVLSAGRGATLAAIADELKTNRYRVGVWLKRYLGEGVKGLSDRPRKGRPKRINSLERHRVIAAACQAPRDLGRERDLWSHDSLSAAVVESALVRAISASTVGRILRGADVKPHLVKMWCHSKDPDYQEKLADIVGLYLDPPHGEPVVCVDEKSGMQALSRARGLVRGEAGRANRLEFEYRRNGTRCLFACFNVRTGHVLGQCTQTRARDDFFAFMDRVAANYRQPRVHVVLDNLTTHRDTTAGDFVSQWNRKHGDRFVFHYTPTHGSWLNQVELWFAILTKRVLRHGSFENPDELVGAIGTFIEQWNLREAHPFRWTYDGLPLVA
jgi:transposase